MPLSKLRTALLLAGTCLAGVAHAQSDRTFMRYPTQHGATLVFVAHGNLWEVDKAGGVARRLTSDPGEDLMPRYSPDGKWIAFTAGYQGNPDVYVIPAGGGAARRLTFHSDIVAKAPTRWGPNNMVLTWTPDSKNIVYLSRDVAWNTWYSRPFEVPVDGGLPVPMPLDRAGLMSFGPDGYTVAYTRIFRDFRTWKRYDGGLAQDIYTYDFKTKKLSRLTDYQGTSTAPMWAGRKIYFLSDRDEHRRANIWVHDLDSGQDREITHFTDYDVDFPSLGDSAIVFQQGGDLYTIDLPTEKLNKLSVSVPDDGTRTGTRFVHADKQLRPVDSAQQPDFALSPNGKRAAFSARGDIFTVPEEHGVTRDITQTSTADEDHPAWSPDGKSIAYTTDSSGGQQLATRPATGGAEKLLTHFPTGFFYTPVWSPNGKFLAFSDGTHKLWVVGLDSSPPKMIAEDPYSEIHDQSWSPDGRYLLYSLSRPTHLRAIWLHDVSTGQSVQLSDAMEDDSLPLFSPDGKYLVFLSNRHENPTFSQSEMNVATLKTAGIYLAPLAKDAPSPFAPQSDEGTVEAEKTPDEDKAKPARPPAPKPIHIDVDGLMARAIKLPIDAGNIVSLDMRDNNIFYQTNPLQMIEGTLPGEKSTLHIYDLKEQKDSVSLLGLDTYSLSADGKKVLIKTGSDFSIVDAKPDQLGSHKKLRLDGMRMRVNPRQEWVEMFDNAWRLERDLFVNSKMNGVNWQEVHDSYAKLLPLVGSREDLNYLIGQIQGELGNSHTYVGGGDDQDTTEPVPTALLGADLAVDAKSGRTVFARVLLGDNTRSDYRSPLTEPGLDIKTGDFLLAVDGHELKAPESAYDLLVGAPEQVTLTVSSAVDGKRHDVVVEPLKQELSLREKAFIDHNKALVDKLSGGRIAYVYLSNMESLGMEQFIRQFYPQTDRHALIVDDRWNGGGFIDQILLERLRRTLVGMETNREHVAETIPGSLIDGPKICLINHYSASDGDIFPWFFRKYGLGPLLGTRTWGGVRGIRGNWDLLDGGYITVPEGSNYGLDSKWVIENRGVEPDIAIEDDPADIMADKDVQLEAAVKYLLTKLDADPHTLPPAPPLLPAYPTEPHKAKHGD